MALLKCTECGGQVSEYADTCPHCGCPVNRMHVLPSGRNFAEYIEAVMKGEHRTDNEADYNALSEYEKEIYGKARQQYSDELDYDLKSIHRQNEWEHHKRTGLYGRL